MSGAAEPAREPDLDQVLDAAVRFVEASTYADSARRVDERTIFGSFRDRPADADRFRDDADRAEEAALVALFGLLDHERVMRLIPQLSSARWRTANRAKDEYEQLPQSQHAADDHVDAGSDADASSDAAADGDGA